MKIVFFIAVPIPCASQFHPVSSLWGSGLREEERPAAEIFSSALGQALSVLLSAANLGLKMKVHTRNTDPFMWLLS